ncbi:sigma-70 family RNA polymerase sigma factor [Micromonospora orduensis]|uniref:sigma-70 family RNA polymerase sigma factor n=1 Tax=Micromonospora orduensis TaxID=1420891 RepID=UPI0036313EEB
MPAAAPTAQASETDEAALRRLQQVHGPVLLSFLTRLTRGDVRRADDIVQETLLRAWRDPEARNADGRWSRASLFTIAKRILVDQAPATEARPSEVSDEYVETPAHTGGGPVERALDTAEVRAALAALPERLRITLVEIYFQERSVAEVAEVLDVPPGTVRSRTSYALRALREALAGREFESREPPAERGRPRRAGHSAPAERVDE